MNTALNRPVVWAIGGNDSGGGAGVAADLRALSAFGVHGCAAIAAVTAQNSVAVTQIDPVAPAMVAAQLDALAADLIPAAVKTGMVGSAANLDAIGDAVIRLRAAQPLPWVVDPVLRASTGAAFADDELIAAYRRWLPQITLLAPNRAEAAALLGKPSLDRAAEVEAAAAELVALGCDAVLITGGDAGSAFADDYLHSPQASGWLRLPRMATAHAHGTGCTCASAAAAALALGYTVADAAVLAKMATAQALRNGYPAGAGAGPVGSPAGFVARDNLPLMTLAGQPLAALDARPSFAPLDGADRDLGLYAVLDSATALARALDAGVRCVQLRVKDPQAATFASQIAASVAAAQRVGAQLYINDHWRAALAAGAPGVHLGQEDLPGADLHALAAAGVRLGISTHSVWEVCRAATLNPSYIACGPLYPTTSKDMPWIAQGNDNLAFWSALLAQPVVGIGGIDVDRARSAAAAGAAGIAVIRALTEAKDWGAAAQQLQHAIAAGRSDPRWPVPVLPRPTLD